MNRRNLWLCAIIILTGGCAATHTSTKPSEVSIQNRDVITTKFSPVPRQHAVDETGEVIPLPPQVVSTPQIISVAGHQIAIPADTVVEVEVEKIRSGTARSASLRTDADEVAANFEQTQPSMVVNGSSGGTASLSADLSLASASGEQRIFWGAGIGLLIGSAAAIFWLGNRPLALTLGVSGGVVIGVGILVQNYPWVALVAVVAGLGVVAHMLLGDRAKGKYAKALSAITGGIEAAPPDEAAGIKRLIGERADAEDKRTILRVKSGG